METYENEPRNQMGSGDLSNQQTDPTMQQQQANYDNDGMASPQSGNMNDDEEEMDDDTMIDDDDDEDDADVEELEEDNQGTGGGMNRESDMNRGTMSAS
jgi:hypothetical protein